jgi:hypothetical protein
MNQNIEQTYERVQENRASGRAQRRHCNQIKARSSSSSTPTVRVCLERILGGRSRRRIDTRRVTDRGLRRSNGSKERQGKDEAMAPHVNGTDAMREATEDVRR